MESVIDKLSEIETAASRIMESAVEETRRQDNAAEERTSTYDNDTDAQAARTLEAAKRTLQEQRIPTGIGNQAIVQVAASQEGKGGTTYWRWYGFGGRVEWCACFVSWCADQSGYIQSGVIPKFSLCSDGVRWFESKGRFRDGSYTPVAGDIIFFDWGNNGTIDHVGIVESVSGGTVNTIEGNSGDKVARRNYSIGSSNIYGYGVPSY